MDVSSQQNDRAAQANDTDAFAGLLTIPQSSSHHLASMSRSFRDIGSDRSNVNRKDSSLFYEFCDTFRRLLQHMVFVPLLVLRLYMLPLLYIARKLAMSDDPWYSMSWNMLRHPHRTLTLCARCCKRGGNVTLAETWTNIREGVFTTLRIIKALYTLGKLIGEDPNVLQPESGPLLDAPDSAIDVQSEHEKDSKVFENDFSDSRRESMASASQIYNTALLNGSTLDDILAAFERNKQTASARTAHALICQNPLDPTKRRASGQQTLSDKSDDQRSCTSSIQTTPERMLLPRKDAESSRCSPAKENAAEMEEELQTPINEARGTPKEINVEDRHEHDAIGSRPRSSTSHHTHTGSTRQTEGRSLSTTTLKRCPTFIRRQTQGRLSERPASGDKRSLAVLQERATRSTPTLAGASPTKRARLQRRVKVYQESAKSPDPQHIDGKRAVI